MSHNIREAITLEDDDISGGEESVDRGILDSHVYIEPGIKTIKTIVMRFDEMVNNLLETSIVYTNIFIGRSKSKDTRL